MSNNTRIFIACIFFIVGSLITLYAFLVPTDVVELEAVPVGKNMAVFYYQKSKTDIVYRYSFYYPGNYEKLYRISYWYGTEYIAVPEQESSYSLLDLQEAIIDGSGYVVSMRDAHDLYTSKDNYRHSVKLELLNFFKPLLL